MKKYIGVKIVEAEQMTANDARNARYSVPSQLDGCALGYEVTYPGGYKSWCPYDAFRKANRGTDGMPFGHAIEAARNGMKIARAGWNSDGVFVFLSYPETICAENIRSRHKDSLNFSKTDSAMIVLPCFAMKTATGKVLFGWSPSQTDALTDDWCIVE